MDLQFTESQLISDYISGTDPGIFSRGGRGGRGPGLKSSKKEGVQPLKLGNLH